MINNIKLIVFPVKDLNKDRKFFDAFLGTEPYVQGSFYVGYKLGNLEVGLDPNGKAVVSYIDVDDIETSLKTLRDAGGKVVMGTKNVGGGLLIAQVKVEDNILGLRQQTK